MWNELMQVYKYGANYDSITLITLSLVKFIARDDVVTYSVYLWIWSMEAKRYITRWKKVKYVYIYIKL
jgi:hypothetical protein